MAEQPVEPKAPPYPLPRRPYPRSALRTTPTAQELKGMRSIRRPGRDTWEQRLAEAHRIALARARRLYKRGLLDAE